MKKTLLSIIAAAGMAVGGCDKDTKYVTVTQTPQPEVYVCNDAVQFALDENERMGDVRETLTDVDLSKLLKGSTIVTPSGTNEVNQYVHFGPTPLMTYLGTTPNDLRTGSAFFSENEADVMDNYLFFDDGDRLFIYDLEFEEGLDSAIDANGNLTDLIGKEINMLGDVHRFTRAQLNGTQLHLGLMSGDFKSQGTASGEQKYVIGNKEYEVEVLSADINGNAQYSVNGEITPVRSPNDIYRLADGMVFGHVGTTNTNGIPTSVDFAFNADKWEMIDENTTDNLEATLPPDRQNEDIEDARIKIRGQDIGNGTYELQDIRYSLFADAKLGDVYIEKGKGLRSQLDEPEGIPGNQLDIVYAGKNANGKHIVLVGNCKKQ